MTFYLSIEIYTYNRCFTRYTRSNRYQSSIISSFVSPTSSGVARLCMYKFYRHSYRSRWRNNRALELLETCLGGSKFFLEVCLLRIRLNKSVPSLLQERLGFKFDTGEWIDRRLQCKRNKKIGQENNEYKTTQNKHKYINAPGKWNRE